MNITLGDLVREIVEVYVDDIIVKTRESDSLLENLAQVFDKLRATSTKLNLEKCVFGVSTGKLLGFLVSHRGIEANPDKVRAIEAMRPPARLKDVQRLTGSLAALSRFISRLAERALPFFKLMRGSFMRRRLGILKRISFFMLYSLRPGNSAITSKPTRLWW
jgi:hypothetical protein